MILDKLFQLTNDTIDMPKSRRDTVDAQIFLGKKKATLKVDGAQSETSFTLTEHVNLPRMELYCPFYDENGRHKAVERVMTILDGIWKEAVLYGTVKLP